MSAEHEIRFDVAVVGGGLVGSAIAWGLARLGAAGRHPGRGRRRATAPSRGNFALVWVQSKGLGMPRIRRLDAALLRQLGRISPRSCGTRRASTSRTSGPAASCSPVGGRAGDRAARDEAAAQPARLCSPYDWEILDRAAVASEVPGIGPGCGGRELLPARRPRELAAAVPRPARGLQAARRRLPAGTAR